MHRLIVTEHTTTDDPYCTIADADGVHPTGEFYGSLDEFRATIAGRTDVRIVEEGMS